MPLENYLPDTDDTQTQQLLPLEIVELVFLYLPHNDRKKWLNVAQTIPDDSKLSDWEKFDKKIPIMTAIANRYSSMRIEDKMANTELEILYRKKSECRNFLCMCCCAVNAGAQTLMLSLPWLILSIATCGLNTALLSGPCGDPYARWDGHHPIFLKNNTLLQNMWARFLWYGCCPVERALSTMNKEYFIWNLFFCEDTPHLHDGLMYYSASRFFMPISLTKKKYFNYDSDRELRIKAENELLRSEGHLQRYESMMRPNPLSYTLSMT
ncbi:MAG: hypothetical protein NTU49_08485 [Gammaproteobacteria bacterium]|nr:hypothetical protein [Gammaproteobacteria bacterium]